MRFHIKLASCIMSPFRRVVFLTVLNYLEFALLFHWIYLSSKLLFTDWNKLFQDCACKCIISWKCPLFIQNSIIISNKHHTLHNCRFVSIFKCSQVFKGYIIISLNLPDPFFKLRSIFINIKVSRLCLCTFTVVKTQTVDAELYDWLK